MRILLPVTAIALGTLTALGLHFLFRQLREQYFVAVATTGALVALLFVLPIAPLTWVYLTMRSEPLASMAPFWGRLALMLSVLLLVCAGIGCVQQRALHISWFHAFGGLMAVTGTAILAAFSLHQMEFSIAGILRGNGNEVRQILDSFDRARHLILCFDSALACVLLFLEVFGYFIRP